MSSIRKAWLSLNFDKEFLFGFENLVFGTSGILSMHKQLVTLQRESKTWKKLTAEIINNYIFIIMMICNITKFSKLGNDVWCFQHLN